MCNLSVENKNRESRKMRLPFFIGSYIATFIFSFFFLWIGIWLNRLAATECEAFLQIPLMIIVVGVVLMVLSITGIVLGLVRGVRRSLSLLIPMGTLPLLLLLFCFTVFAFAFVVTNKGAGEALSGKGYKEYDLDNYSNWFQERVNRTEHWRKIKSCLQDKEKVCQSLIDDDGPNTRVEQFCLKNLTSVQSGCCKPSNDCNFTYVSPTKWTHVPAADPSSYNNSDCSLWSNDPNLLCFNCQSCKAGLLDRIQHEWYMVAFISLFFLGLLVIMYVCSFAWWAYLKNNRNDLLEQQGSQT